MHSFPVVYRKQAETPELMERLGQEASILKAVAHPNVVYLLGITITADKASLRLAQTDAHPLSEANLDLEAYAGVILSAAVTLAHVHAQSVAHNRIDGRHVLVREDLTAVLCGFGDATFTIDTYAQLSDVKELASLLQSRIAREDDPLRARINGVVDGRTDLVEALRATADVACDGDMTAVAFAQKLRQILEHTPNDSPERTGRKLRVSWKAVATVVVPLVLIGVAISVLTDHKAKASTTIAYSPAPAINTACKQIDRASLAIDTDGNGCPNQVLLGNGTVTLDGERYAVGKDGDQLLVGDWKGDNLATLALLRPATGELFIFDSWPARGAFATPRVISTIPGATGFDDKRSGHHDVIVVHSATGDVTVDPQTPVTTTTLVGNQ